MWISTLFDNWQCGHSLCLTTDNVDIHSVQQLTMRTSTLCLTVDYADIHSIWQLTMRTWTLCLTIDSADIDCLSDDWQGWHPLSVWQLARQMPTLCFTIWNVDTQFFPSINLSEANKIWCFSSVQPVESSLKSVTVDFYGDVYQDWSRGSCVQWHKMFISWTRALIIERVAWHYALYLTCM